MVGVAPLAPGGGGELLVEGEGGDGDAGHGAAGAQGGAEQPGGQVSLTGSGTGPFDGSTNGSS